MKIDFDKVQFDRLEEINKQMRNMYLTKKWHNGIASYKELKDEKENIIANLTRRGKWSKTGIKK